ncbi:MAG: terminase gpP N-terminus-related DNA-binding protein, partial [Aeromonas sp.]
NGWNVAHWRRKFNLQPNLRPRANMSRAPQLYAQGYTDKRIAEILGHLTTWAIAHWRQSRALPPNTRYERAFHPD